LPIHGLLRFARNDDWGSLNCFAEPGIGRRFAPSPGNDGAGGRNQALQLGRD
jgi:hypothetical protein